MLWSIVSAKVLLAGPSSGFIAWINFMLYESSRRDFRWTLQTDDIGILSSLAHWRIDVFGDSSKWFLIAELLLCSAKGNLIKLVTND